MSCPLVESWIEAVQCFNVQRGELRSQCQVDLMANIHFIENGLVGDDWKLVIERARVGYQCSNSEQLRDIGLRLFC